MKVVTARVPEKYLRDLERIEKEEHADRAEVVRRLLAKAIASWKMERAVELLRKHKVSLRKAAELADISYVEVLDLASEAGVDSGYSLEDLRGDLERI